MRGGAANSEQPGIFNTTLTTATVASLPASPITSRATGPTKRVTRANSSIDSAAFLRTIAPLPVSPATKELPSIVESWSPKTNEEGVYIDVISAESHARKLAPTCSWLHQWEHARALHVGIPQGKIKWANYPYKGPNLEQMLAYLQECLPEGKKLERPKESLWTEIPTDSESIEELSAAFKLGTVHFTGELALSDRSSIPVLRLCPASAGMGSNLYRKYGSDRFFRLKLDDKISRAGAPMRPKPGGPEARLVETLKTFFHHPLGIFGRQYRPFCQKDGAMIYWCERGPGLKTIPLVSFCQKYIDVELNKSMTVAKWIARFELGLTTTTPTVTFARNQVFRTPDLTSDTLKISYQMMKLICSLLQNVDPVGSAESLPDGYIPSAIRGSYWQSGRQTQKVELVWQLDYSTCPRVHGDDSTASSTKLSIQARPVGDARAKPMRLQFAFEIRQKDGQSKSTEYFTKPDEVDWVNDNPAKGVVMTDGCSLMSFAAMEKISEMLVESEGVARLVGGLPPAAQGRLGPGKGVWAVAPDEPWGQDALFIEVRDSQWKFNDNQTNVYTFELHSIPTSKDSAKLGKQTFEVLAHCGVPNQVFRDLLKAQLETGKSLAATQTFFDWSDPLKLLYHLQKETSVIDDRTRKAQMSSNPSLLKINTFNSSDFAGDDPEKGGDESGAYVHDGRLDASSGAPNTINELADEMLQAGFDPDGSHPNSSPVLAAKLAWIAEEFVKQNVSFRLNSEQCRTALVVADHLGILAEGEIFYQASERIVRQKRRSNVVLGPVLVTRPPAVQPCDVQKFQAVFRDEYADVYDIIVMSSKGSRPACSILSGGDYDGDKLLIITDPAIVESFNESLADPKFADPPFKDEDWFEVDRRRVRDLIIPLVKSHDSSSLAKNLIAGYFQDVKFGMLSKLHTKLAFMHGLDHSETSLVGHLFAKALDGRKQGLSISDAKWNEIHARFKGSFPMPEWTHREDGKLDVNLDGVFVAERGKDLGRHVMDELVSEGRNALANTKREFRGLLEGLKATVDEDLAGLWRSQWNEARKRNAEKKEGDPFYRDMLKILAHVKTFFAEYKTMRERWSMSRHQKAQTAKHDQAPGSPTKSPSKGRQWKGGSSRDQKQDLALLTKGFWRLVESPESFESIELRGFHGPESARALMASCAYIEPLEPESLRQAPRDDGSGSLLDRFRRSETLATTSTSSSFASASTTLSSDRDAMTDVDIPTISDPSPADNKHDDAEEDPFARYSQLPLTQLEKDAIAAVAARPTRSSLALSSTTFDSTLSPTSLTRASTISTTMSSWPLSPSRPKAYMGEFHAAGKSSRSTFCFDMCHRDVLGLKADALWRKVHDGRPTANGIQGRKVAPEMLDAMTINRRCAGVAKAHSKKRPFTLLPSPTPLSGGPSPSKKAKTL